MHDDITPWYREILRDDLSTFIGKTLQTVNPSAAFVPSWHVDLIAEYLQAVRQGNITRLLINLPPRSLKSICVSVAWPAWILGHHPDSRIIAASYSSALSLKHSLDCRLLVSSSWYREVFPSFSIAPGQNEKHKFVTTSRGFRFATSVGGSLTGEGGQIVIVDDPLNPRQAMSSHYREQCRSWFDQTVATRLDDKKTGVIVVVMQRLHEDDLSGHLLAKGGWEHLCIPAVSQQRRAFSAGKITKVMEAGEVLQPVRESEAILARIHRELGGRAFAAQYLQAPLASESSMIRREWIQRWRFMPAKFDAIIQSWDTGIKAGEGHDPSACLTFGQLGPDHYLIDCVMQRVEYPQLRRLLMKLAEQSGAQLVMIEDKASGQQLIQEMRYLLPLPVLACKPEGDKISRFSRITPLIEAGQLWLPEEAPWLSDFESQLMAFPQAPHDDAVDALSQYFGWVQQRAWKQPRLRLV